VNESLNKKDTEKPSTATVESAPSHFIRNIIIEDLKQNKNGGRVHTRFPPEPNGYLHIGHAKSICLNFGLAAEFNGLCNLRFDDTNPSKEDVEYVDSIKEDIRWLGFDWDHREYYASDYFERLYQFAIQLIKGGKAYVCDLSADEMRDYRGTLTEPGKNSPYRERPIEENLDLLQRMKAGEFPDGARTLRAKIDMASPNLNMRDPVMYRILHATHHSTGDKCVFIRLMISPTANRIRSRESRIRSVRWNSKITDRFTTGFSISSIFIIRSRLNSPASISLTRC